MKSPVAGLAHVVEEEEEEEEEESSTRRAAPVRRQSPEVVHERSRWAVAPVRFARAVTLP
jgi:hypothetical protein